MRIGFLVNPVAGMGGRVALKGTDGVASEAASRGAVPWAPVRAQEMLTHLDRLARVAERISALEFLCCGDPMGVEAFSGTQLRHRMVFSPPTETSAADTRKAVAAFMAEGIELIVFCGGDGTARDVFDVVRDKVPILGVPCGVKMHSAVFAVTPKAAADAVMDYVDGEVRVGRGEVIDLDEEKYRGGAWAMKLYGEAATLQDPTFIQAGKMLFEEVSEDSVRDEIAAHLKEEMGANTERLYILGPGGTLEHVGKALGIPKTHLGVDLVRGGKLLFRDVGEREILAALSTAKEAAIVVSPIGQQGFILGRGNLQISPAVLRRVGVGNVLVVSTPAKLARTPVLRVDTGEASLDAEFTAKEYMFVLVGYRARRLHPIAAASLDSAAG